MGKAKSNFDCLIAEIMMKSIFKTIAGTAATMIVVAGTCYAGPNVSAISQNNGKITIQGNEFGNRPNYGAGQPFLNRGWNTFENGAFDGGNLDGGGNNWRMVTTGNRPNSSHHIEKFYNDSRGEYYGLKENSGSGHHQWYTSFWFKLLPNTQSGKFFRIWGDPSSDNIYLSTGGSNTMIRGSSESKRVTHPGQPSQWSTSDSFGSNTWRRVEIFITDNPSEFTVWIDGKWQFTRKDWVPTPFNAAGAWEVGGMIDGPGQGNGAAGAYCFDDIYFDNTRARVEIGNAPTWSDSTVREPQLLTSWSNTSISVNLNQGAFSNGTKAYLYVVDSDGNISNGYPITIGATGGSKQLSSPKKLRVLN